MRFVNRPSLPTRDTLLKIIRTIKITQSLKYLYNWCMLMYKKTLSLNHLLRTTNVTSETAQISNLWRPFCNVRCISMRTTIRQSQFMHVLIESLTRLIIGAEFQALSIYKKPTPWITRPESTSHMNNEFVHWRHHVSGQKWRNLSVKRPRFPNRNKLTHLSYRLLIALKL
jgi:hypothetical protein